MNLLKTAVKSHRSILQTGQANQRLASLLPRRFSTGAEDAKQTDDSFLHTPPSGLVYGRLLGITKHTTKRDILNLLEGCNLNLEDIKVDYARSYAPTAMMIQFPSRSDYDAAIREIGRKGRLYRLDRADRSQWDLIAPYDGKAILLQGIPRNALIDDVERFLSGCQYDATSLQLFTRPAFPDPIRMALVRFPARALAMHAFITKNQGFCLNSQIKVRVLH